MPSHDDPPAEDDCAALTNLGPTNLGVSLQQLKILNAVAFVSTIAFNGLSATGVLSPYKVGEVGDMHPTKITPAGGAFSIWSVIYILEALFILYSLFGHCVWSSSSSEDAMLLHGVGFWFVLACLFNALWIITFVQGNDVSLWCSTVLIASLLYSLCKMYLGADCWARRHPGGLAQRCSHTLLIDIHFSMYAGWVTVATIVNISVALTSTGWSAPGGSVWTVVMLCVALLPISYIVITRQDCVWGLVLAWASAWIAVANSGDTTVVAGSMVVCSLIATISAIVIVRVLVAVCSSCNNDSGVVPEAVSLESKDDDNGQTSASGSHTLTA